MYIYMYVTCVCNIYRYTDMLHNNILHNAYNID